MTKEDGNWLLKKTKKDYLSRRQFFNTMKLHVPFETITKLQNIPTALQSYRESEFQRELYRRGGVQHFHGMTRSRARKHFWNAKLFLSHDIGNGAAIWTIRTQKPQTEMFFILAIGGCFLPRFISEQRNIRNTYRDKWPIVTSVEAYSTVSMHLEMAYC